MRRPATVQCLGGEEGSDSQPLFLSWSQCNTHICIGMRWGLGVYCPLSHACVHAVEVGGVRCEGAHWGACTRTHMFERIEAA